MAKTYRVPILMPDGSTALVAPNYRGRIEIDGLEVENVPPQPPPNGQFPIVVGGTTYLVPFIAVWSTMNMTTVARVKAHLTGFSTTADDAFIDDLIAGVSNHFERYMRRTVLKGTYTRTLRLRQFEKVVTLDAAPIESITSVKYASNPSLLATATAMDASDYAISGDGEGGHVEFLREMNLKPGFVEVVYVGGMAEDQADLEISYPDLVQAADIQCAYEYTRRTTPGGAVSMESGSATFESPMNLIPRVKSTLDSLRRHLV